MTSENAKSPERAKKDFVTTLAVLAVVFAVITMLTGLGNLWYVAGVSAFITLCFALPALFLYIGWLNFDHNFYRQENKY